MRGAKTGNILAGLRPHGGMTGMCMRDTANLRRRVVSAITRLKEGHADYDSIVLDEILVAYSFGHISEAELRGIISMSPEKEWYLTGRMWGDDGIPFGTTVMPLWMLEWADYVMVIQEIKHPYRDGVDARIGVEW